MENCKISVIVPCYNVAEYIPRCMESLQAQTFKDFEVICINDGSVDDPPLNILNKYKTRGVKIYSTENRGVVQARNEGIKLARGEYLYFFDPDDLIEPNALEVVYNKAVETGSDAVQFNFQTISVSSGIRYE